MGNSASASLSISIVDCSEGVIVSNDHLYLWRLGEDEDHEDDDELPGTRYAHDESTPSTHEGSAGIAALDFELSAARDQGCRCLSTSREWVC